MGEYTLVLMVLGQASVKFKSLLQPGKIESDSIFFASTEEQFTFVCYSSNTQI